MQWTLYSAHQREIMFDKPAVMAIMNATPDSFSDGGMLEINVQLMKHIENIIAADADIIDVGGESTRPGHMPVSADEETTRVVRVIKAIREQNEKIPISVDTQKVSVARASIAAGADFVNDVSGLTDPELAGFVDDSKCSVVLMRHRALGPNLVEDCSKQTLDLVKNAQAAGIDSAKLILDPGLGFGDLAEGDFSALPGGDVAANLDLIYRLNEWSFRYYGRNVFGIFKICTWRW